MISDESRPYAAASQRYLTWTDEWLMHDPFGYYIPRPIAGSSPDPNFVYMEDFPVNDSKWEVVSLGLDRDIDNDHK